MNVLADTTYSELADVKPIKIEGLWFDYNGEKTTPRRIYFSSDLREWHNDERMFGGRAYCHYDNALRPVFDKDNNQFVFSNLRNVVGEYNGKEIKDFYIE